MSLSQTREDLIELIQEGLGVVAAGHPVAKIGGEFEQLCTYLQALGACNLLLTLEPVDLHRNLVLSAYTRRYYLQRSRAEENNSELRAISRTEAVLDAVAAGTFDLALAIIDLAPSDWIADGEYEDDYCYFWFLHTFLRGFGKTGQPVLSAAIERFEKALEGAPSARLRVCKSLAALDQAAFAEAFRALLDQREQQMRREKKTANIDLTYGPRCGVFVEGLALLAIADRLQFATDDEYPGCPRIARRMQFPPPRDIYVELEQIIHS